jgi:hypothetical protein
VTLSPASSAGGTVTAAGIQATFTAAGQIYQGTGAGTGALVFPPGYEFDYVAITAGVTIVTATTVITGNAVTYDGATRVKVEFFTYQLVAAAVGQATIDLYEGATHVAVLDFLEAASGASLLAPCFASTFITPSAGAHTYTIKGTSGSGTGTVGAGSGAAGNPVPAYYRVTKA